MIKGESHLPDVDGNDEEDEEEDTAFKGWVIKMKELEERKTKWSKMKVVYLWP